MPIFEIEKGGQVYEVDAPDQQTALAALSKMEPAPKPTGMAGALNQRLTERFGPELVDQIDKAEVMGQGMPLMPGIVDVGRRLAPGVLSKASEIGGRIVRSPTTRKALTTAAKEAVRMAGWGAAAKFFD